LPLRFLTVDNDKASIVYFIADDRIGPVKVGVTKDLKSRFSNLQTGNPRELKLMAWIVAENKKEAEKLEAKIHDYFEHRKERGEWYNLGPEEIYELLRDHFYYDGFLAVSEAALQIVAVDRGGVPLLGAVWDWAYLNWEECCPYCGSVMGLRFEEKFMAHHCLNCGVHIEE
jgi:predicted GIY-YIG superfamily endonuclease